MFSVCNKVDHIISTPPQDVYYKIVDNNIGKLEIMKLAQRQH